MISEEIGHGERVRILDFGLARLQGNVGRDATQTNMVVGTPNYMAPEQTVPGAALDGRADLYAVGIVLFEMIAGARPFNAEDTMQLLGMHRAAPIPRIADQLPPGTDLPFGVQEILDRALAKSRDARFQTAIEFATAIDEVLAGKLDPMEIDATLPKMKSGPVFMPARGTLELGSTVLDADASDARDELPRKRSRLWLSALLLVVGTGATAVYFVTRAPNQSTATLESVEQAGSGATSMVAMGAEDAAPALHDAAVVSGDDPGALMSDGSVAAIDDPGVDEDEIQIDPAIAEDPDDNAGSAAPPEDEDDDAPKSEEEIEQREPPAPVPQLARTVKQAVAMIKAGKKPLALSSLRVLWKKQPGSSYIPFLMGNLYFDKKWWSVSLDHYKTAIKKDPAFRRNAVLNRNVIRMLASAKTRQSATNFIRGTIGPYAKRYLAAAAKTEKNPVVRKEATRVARMIR
jgi:hypothetical protein